MHKKTSTIKGFIYVVIFAIGGFMSAYAQPTSKNKVQQPLPFSQIKSQCKVAIDDLTKLNDFALSPSFAQTLKDFEQHIIPAKNVLFESYLFANVSPDETVRVAAEQCQSTLAAQIDIVLASNAFAKLLNHVKGLPKTPLQERVFKKYQQQHLELADSNFLTLKHQAKQATTDFRKTTTITAERSFHFDKACVLALSKKYQNKFIEHGDINAAINGKNYAAFIKRFKTEDCRKAVYQQYQGRHKTLNQGNLMNMISLQNQKAQALGFEHFADYSLQNTSFSTATQVEQFLSGLAALQPPSPAPWNNRYVEFKSASKKPKSQVEKHSLLPQQAKQGLFTLLNDEFNLQVVKVNQSVWHPSVEVYQLNREGQLIGDFYLDLYSREGKYKKNRHRAIKRGVTGVQLPASALILNLPKNQWQQKHIKSFFHEFGHLLHNLLAQQPYHIVAGISLEKDLIEMPAKWFEWLSFSPDMQQKMFNKVLFAGEKPDTGTKFKLRLYRAALALAYFSKDINSKNIDALSDKLSRQYTGYPHLAGADSQYSFSHLGTYGPRYYNYIWSEKVAQKLLIDYLNNRFTGQAFMQALLVQGGSVSMADMFSLLYQKTITISDITQWVNNEKQL